MSVTLPLTRAEERARAELLMEMKRPSLGWTLYRNRCVSGGCTQRVVKVLPCGILVQKLGLLPEELTVELPSKRRTPLITGVAPALPVERQTNGGFGESQNTKRFPTFNDFLDWNIQILRAMSSLAKQSRDLYAFAKQNENQPALEINGYFVTYLEARAEAQLLHDASEVLRSGFTSFEIDPEGKRPHFWLYYNMGHCCSIPVITSTPSYKHVTHDPGNASAEYLESLKQAPGDYVRSLERENAVVAPIVRIPTLRPGLQRVGGPTQAVRSYKVSSMPHMAMTN